MKTNTPQISIVSPVYGCRECLKALVATVRDTLDAKNLTWELVLVDDCAPDAPWDLIKKLASADKRIIGVKLARNHGQHLAIWAGLDVTRGDWTAVIDCDLQDDPTMIPQLLESALSQETDAVVVDRGSWSDSKLRRLSSTLFYKTFKYLTGVTISNVGNFGLYSRRMVNALLQYKEQEVFLPMMVTLTGLPVSYFRVDRSDRVAGESSYSFRRLLGLAVAITIRFSDRPLKLSVLIGLIFSSISAIASITIFFAWLVGSFTVPGWTSIILSLWFLAGLILAVLGVHGFYLGRVFAEVRNRPRIVVAETLNQEAPTPINLHVKKHG